MPAPYHGVGGPIPIRSVRDDELLPTQPAIFLKHDADRWLVTAARTNQLDLSISGGRLTNEHLEQRALPTATRTENGDEFWPVAMRQPRSSW